MAGESLRDLVVSLSLNADNFTRNLKTINNQIKETESAFDLAAAGADNFSRTQEGRAARMALLSGKTDLLSKSVDQYQRRIEQENAKLLKNQTAYERMGQKLTDARKRYTELQQAVEDAKRSYDEISKSVDKKSPFGEEAVAEARQEYERLKTELKDTKDELTKLNRQQASALKSAQTAADQITKDSTALNEAQEEIIELRKELYTLQSAFTKVGAGFERFTNVTRGISTVSTSIGRVMSRYVTLPVAALGTTAVKASIDFESAFAEVRKTVDATETQYAELGNGITEMSEQVARGADELSAITATAGQLGIVNDALIPFTKTVADLSVATEDLKDVEAATVMAKYANITKMNQQDFDKLGSTLVELGNNYATTEGAIMNMSLRLAAAGHQIGLTDAQILGFSAALSSVGLEADAGGSAMSRALMKMEVAAATGGQALTDFATVCGVTEDEFKRMWENDPAEVFMLFIEQLSKLDEEGESTIATLEELGFRQIRLRDTMLRTVNAQELMSSAQESANRAWSENVALTEEANKRYNTTESKLKNLKNKAANAARTFGDDMNRELRGLIDTGSSLLDKINELSPAARRGYIEFAKFIALTGPLSLGVGKVTYGISAGTGVIGKALKALGSLRGQAKSTETSFWSLLSATSGFKGAMVGLGVALAAGGIALAYYTSDAYKAKKAMEGMADAAERYANTQSKTLYDSEGMGAFGLTEEDFIGASAEDVQKWLDGLIGVWTDGKKETDEMLTEWVTSFTEKTEPIREALQEKFGEFGEDSPVTEGLQKDLETLDELDAQVAALLKKKQNGTLTEEDIKTLQGALDQREAIAIKYKLVPEGEGGGYEKVIDGVEKELKKSEALNIDVDPKVYGDAVVAMGQGYAAIVDDLDKAYEAEYDLIKLMDEGAEKDAAEEKLQADYAEKRLAAAREYAAYLAKVNKPIMGEGTSFEKTGEELQSLIALVAEYNGAETEEEQTNALVKLNKAVDKMDTDKLTEYYALLMQVNELRAAGMTDEEINETLGVGEVDVPLEELKQLQQFLEGNKTDLEGLFSIFNKTLPDQILTVTTVLNTEGIETGLTTFQNDPANQLKVNTVIRPTGVDAVALARFKRQSGISQITTNVRLGSLVDEAGEIIDDPSARFFGENGVELDVSMVTADQLTKDTLVAITEAKDGTITRNVIITTQLGEGDTKKMAEELGTDKAFKQTPKTVFPEFATIDLSVLGKIRSALGRIYNYENPDWLAWLTGESDKGRLDQSMKNDFGENDIGALAAYISEIYAQLKAGGDISEEEMENLKLIFEFLDGLKENDVGDTVTSGIETGVTEAMGDGTDFETVKSTLEGVLSDMEEDAGETGGEIMDELTGAITDGTGALARAGYLAGMKLGANIKNGLSASLSGLPNPSPNTPNNGRSSITSAGASLMSEFSTGMEAGAMKAAPVIANASRLLGNALSGGVGAVSAGSASKNIYQTSNVNVNGTFSIRSEQDIRALAYEVSSLIDRRQKGRGA